MFGRSNTFSVRDLIRVNVHWSWYTPAVPTSGGVRRSGAPITVVIGLAWLVTAPPTSAATVESDFANCEILPGLVLFNSAQCWNGNVPGPGDISVWNESFNTNQSYGVLFNAGGATNQLAFVDGNVAWDLGSSTYTLNDLVVGRSLDSDGTLGILSGTVSVSNNVLVSGSGNGTLNIEAGGSLSSFFGYIARGNRTGTVTVTGAGSGWTNSSLLFVGEVGTGTLSVEAGGSVSNSFGRIGDRAAGTGFATVTGVGSTWTNSSELEVGYSGTGTLNIQAGGAVSSTFGRLGTFGSGVGTASLTGSGSTWTNSEHLTVGRFGNGTLSVEAGGSVSNSFGRIGDRAAGTGFATVTGVGSTWTNSSELEVGYSGTGTLNIQAGGAVSSTFGRLGTSGSGVGTASLTGSGSTWTNSEHLTVGRFGNGTLNIEDGGEASSTDGYVGRYFGGTGNTTVTGSDSTWTNSGALRVGQEGSGTLNIENGASVTSMSAGIGYEAGADGVATVDGAGSRWTSGEFGLFEVGRSGTGVLNIENGGEVSVGFGFIGGIAGAAGGDGTVNVSGAGSTWHNDFNLRVGSTGTGTLNISDGGTVTNQDTYIGEFGGSTGAVSVAGANSTWTNTRDLFVGGDAFGEGGSGQVDIGVGAVVDVAEGLVLYATGTVNLNGGTLRMDALDDQGGSLNFNAGTLGIASNLDITSGSDFDGLSLGSFRTLEVDGTLSLTQFSTLTVDGGTLSVGSLVDNTGFAFNRGTLNLTSDELVIGSGGLFGAVREFGFDQQVNVSTTTTIDAGSVLLLDNASFSSGSLINNGTLGLGGLLTQLNGGTVTNNGLVLGTGTVSADLANAANGEIRIGGTDHTTFAGSTNANDGTITVLGGNAQFNAALTNTGRVNLLGGALQSNGSLFNNAGGEITGHGALITEDGLVNSGRLALTATTDVLGDVTNAAGGSITVSGLTTTFYDDVQHNGAEFLVTSGAQAVFFGAYTGAGAFTGAGEVIFAGDLFPGNSPALVEVEGDLTLLGSATTTIELGGLLRGSEYDAFDIGGDLVVDGLLNIAFLDDFVLDFRQSFEIFDVGGNLSGTFLGLEHGDVVGRFNGFDLFISYEFGDGNDIGLFTAVPSTPTLGLVALVLLVLRTRRRDGCRRH